MFYAGGEFRIISKRFRSFGEFFGGFAGGGDEFGVGEAGELEVESPVLEGAVDFAWAAELEVGLGEVEAVGGFFQLFETAGRLVVTAGEEADGGVVTAADTSAELVELGEAVIVGVHDDHEVGVRDVDTDFDDSGGDENVDFSGGEFLHDVVFFGGFHATVEEGDGAVFENFLEFFGLFFDAGGFFLGVVFDGAANPVDLLVFLEIFADDGVEVVAEIDFLDDFGGDGLAAGGEFVQN